jgi:hypothetical protein
MKPALAARGLAQFLRTKDTYMPTANLAETPRRSARVPITIPIRVTSLQPEAQFSEVCETLVVNAHGCALRSPIQLDPGVPVQFRSREGREAMARVVACEPMASAEEGWKLGVKLERPENFWGVRPCPEEWTRLIELPLPGAPKKAATAAPARPARAQVPAALQTAFDKIEKQLSDDHLKSLLAQLVKPLNDEVLELRDKLTRTSRQNRFEVSLNQIPPELEQQLWARLRQDLGAQALEQARQQSTLVLDTATATIEQKIAAAQNEFRHRLTQELQAVEKQAQALNQEITDAARQQFRAEQEKFQQHVLDAGSTLDRRSETRLQALQQSLSDDYHSYRRDVEQIQAAVESKSVALEAQISDLHARTGKLNESVRRLETDLDAHLDNLARQIIASAGAELEAAAGIVMKDLQRRGTADLSTRLDEACDRLKRIQLEIEAAASEQLKAQATEAQQVFEQTMEEMAQHSVGRWRLALSRDLAAVATTLGQHMRAEASCDPDED